MVYALRHIKYPWRLLLAVAGVVSCLQIITFVVIVWYTLSRFVGVSGMPQSYLYEILTRYVWIVTLFIVGTFVLTFGVWSLFVVVFNWCGKYMGGLKLEIRPREGE